MKARMKLKRVVNKPILEPRKDVPWEKSAVLNAAAIHDNGKFHLLYRAVAHNPGDRNRSWIGYASSTDGIHFDRLGQPVLSPGVVPEESQGVEDPRVIKLGDTFHMLYTAYDLKNTRIAMATSKDLIHWKRHGVILDHKLFGDNKDASLFPKKIEGRYCLMHRPAPDIYLSFSTDFHNWTDHVCIMEPEFEWEDSKIGGGAQPIMTEKGWLMIYHGVDKDLTYRLGVALLDPHDPTKVIKRQAEPILEPEQDWELKGDINNVVFTCGAVLLGTELWVYYGCADTVIGVARTEVKKFLADI